VGRCVLHKFAATVPSLLQRFQTNHFSANHILHPLHPLPSHRLLFQRIFRNSPTSSAQMLSNTRCLAVIAVVFAAVSSTAAVGNFPPIWPYPSKFTNGSASMVVDSANFKFSSNLAQSDCPDVYSAFSRFAPVFFPNSQPRKSSLRLDSMLSGVLVTVLNCSVPLQLGVDESYSLEVDTNGG
jgi:hypothetical protein